MPPVKVVCDKHKSGQGVSLFSPLGAGQAGRGNRLPLDNARIKVMFSRDVRAAVAEMRRASAGVLLLDVTRARTANPFTAAGGQPRRFDQPAKVAMPTVARGRSTVDR